MRISIISCILFSAFFLSCNKENEESYHIKATMNGILWSGLHPAGYKAKANDGSFIQIYIATTNPETGNFNFFTNSSPANFPLSLPGLALEKIHAGIFDSKLRVRWSATDQTSVAKYYIERGNSSIYFVIDSVEKQSNSSSVNYTYTDDLINVNHLTGPVYRIRVLHQNGTFSYTNPMQVNIVNGKAQIAYISPSGKTFFALDDNQNQISITSYNPELIERRGTFSFRFKDSTGNIVTVNNGSFKLKN